MLFLPEYLSTAFRASYPGRRISVLHRGLDGLYFSELEGSRKKQVVANSMQRKDYPYSLHIKPKCTQKGWLDSEPALLVLAYFRRFIRSNGEYFWCCIAIWLDARFT